MADYGSASGLDLASGSPGDDAWGDDVDFVGSCETSGELADVEASDWALAVYD